MTKTCSRCGKPHYAKGLCRKCYGSQWQKEHPDKVRESNNKYLNTHTEQKKRNRISIERLIKKQTCNIIKKHHEEMKDDPEHLTTEFIKKLINVEC